MSLMPLKTAITNAHPNPNNETARQGFDDFWKAMYELTEEKEVSVASAASTVIGSVLSGKILVTGITNINSLGTVYRGPLFLRIDTGPVTFVYNATTLLTDGSVDLKAYPGDVLMAYPKGNPINGWILTKVFEATPVRAMVASHATTGAIWSSASKDIYWTGIEVTTAFPAAPYAGAERILHISEACSFTAKANLLIAGKALDETIVLAANDVVRVYAITKTKFLLNIVSYSVQAITTQPRTRRAFYATGIWTKPAGCTRIIVKLQGKGGRSGSWSGNPGGGGGGGGYCEKLIDVTAITSETVTISNVCKFGAHLTANPGGTGAAGGAGGAGGSSTGGNRVRYGQNGQAGSGGGGKGGDSEWGSGAPGVVYNQPSQSPTGGNYGGGASGAGTGFGREGAQGACVVEEFYEA